MCSSDLPPVDPVPESDPVTIIVDNPPDPVKPPDKSPVFPDKSSVPVDKPDKATRKSPAADHVKLADKSPVDLPVVTLLNLRQVMMFQ